MMLKVNWGGFRTEKIRISWEDTTKWVTPSIEEEALSQPKQLAVGIGKFFINKIFIAKA